ncbi:N-acetyltransferase [Terrarubrum flagellatum]|uniref:GNAT family N-acetyltransferase n=1 Tax=Terrirubrum flagellatum TaxID=2895980 RepID=UPI0031455808
MDSAAPSRIRRARIEDADAIAHVHHRSWEETYPGLLPPELIVPLDERLGQWRRIIHENPAGVGRFVAEVDAPTVGDDMRFAPADAPDVRIVGIAQCGPAREPELETRYEIGRIYVLRAAQGVGVGKALMGAMFDALRASHVGGEDRSVGLWVLKGNDRAIEFYERMGARVTGTIKRDERHGFIVEDVGMRWDSF